MPACHPAGEGGAGTPCLRDGIGVHPRTSMAMSGGVGSFACAVIWCFWERDTTVKIAVYGASGYTGKLVVSELRRRDIEVVLAGRSVERLRRVASETGLTGAAVRPASADDPQALAAAFHDCDAVINCAGPFAAFGAAVVRAAIAAGCHYVDTSAEQVFVKDVFDVFGDEAERAGVAVVPATGYDILPGDFAAHLAGERVEPVEEFTIAYDVNDFGMTRGTLRSAFEMLNGAQLGYDDGDWRWQQQPQPRRSSMVFPDRSQEAPVIGWPGCEVVTVPRHVRTRHVEAVINASAATPEFFELLQTPPDVANQIIDGFPEGPTEDERSAAAFTILAEAVGADGRLGRAVLHGRDVYGCTAVIAVEGARRLVASGARSGVLTPAQAYDIEDFLHFLAPYGFSYDVEVLPPVSA
jgi:short subunit dehydrogenase-like uncharacterized protein